MRSVELATRNFGDNAIACPAGLNNGQNRHRNTSQFCFTVPRIDKSSGIPALGWSINARSN
jgi:hypothetical protein